MWWFVPCAPSVWPCMVWSVAASTCWCHSLSPVLCLVCILWQIMMTSWYQYALVSGSDTMHVDIMLTSLCGLECGCCQHIKHFQVSSPFCVWCVFYDTLHTCTNTNGEENSTTHTPTQHYLSQQTVGVIVRLEKEVFEKEVFKVLTQHAWQRGHCTTSRLYM